MPDKTIVVMPPLGPASIRWNIARADRIWGEVNSMAFQSEYRPNSRWEADFTFPQRKGARTQALEALLVRGSRGDHAIMVPDHKSAYKGAFDPHEQVMEPKFLTDQGWTSGIHADVSIYNYEARVETLISTPSDAYLRLNYTVPTTANQFYAYRVAWRRGTSSATNDAHVRILLEGATSNPTNGNTGVGLGGVITRLHTQGTSVSVRPSIQILGTDVFRAVYIDWVSFARCLVVRENAGPTRLRLGGFPPDLPQALVRGQMLEFCTANNTTALSQNQGWAKSELKKVVGHVSSNASGDAWVEVEPPLRNLPPNMAPVIVNEPCAKMIFSDPSFAVSRQESGFTGIGIKLMEDVNAIS